MEGTTYILPGECTSAKEEPLSSDLVGRLEGFNVCEGNVSDVTEERQAVRWDLTGWVTGNKGVNGGRGSVNVGLRVDGLEGRSV